MRMDRFAILAETAKQIKTPVFCVNLRSTDLWLHDSFGETLKKQFPDSAGTGLHVTSNLQDMLILNNDCMKRFGKSADIFVYDLSDAGNLKKFTSMAEFYRYTDFLGDMTRYMLEGLYFTYYQKNPYKISGGKFKSSCTDFCSVNGIAEEDVLSWIQQNRHYYEELTASDRLDEMENPATRFQKEIMHIDGTDTTALILGDSSSMGSVIFYPQRMEPVLNLGKDEEAGRLFYSMVHDKIIEPKFANMERDDAEAIKKLAYWGRDSLDPEFDLRRYMDRLKEKYKKYLQSKTSRHTKYIPQQG